MLEVLLQMALNVLVEVWFLSETVWTIFFSREGASEGPFASVNPQMIIKVVELAEVLVAILVVALQDFQVAFRGGVLVAVHSEVLCEVLRDRVRTYFENFLKLCLLQLVASLHSHEANRRRNLILNFGWADLAPFDEMLLLRIISRRLFVFHKWIRIVL